MESVCLISPAHLANNPRLVKEAGALAEAGYAVRVVACQYLDWASRTDQLLLQGAKWKADLVRFSRRDQPWLFWKSRFRQHGCKKILRLVSQASGFGPVREWLAMRAFDRVLPELTGRALHQRADLFVAHNLQALPIAVCAARRHSAKAGFDAEDFHSGMRNRHAPLALDDRVTEFYERRYLPECAYVSAASPGVAEAYAGKYAMRRPTPILNVFPLAHRPREYRPSRPSGPLRLYWFSQTIGTNRGLEEVICALGRLRGYEIELHLRGNWQPGFQARLSALAATEGVPAGRILDYPPDRSDEMVRLAAPYDVGLALELPLSPNRAICMRDLCTNKVFTYLLAGNAVVATGESGTQTILEGAGRAYSPGQVDALAQILKSWFEERGDLEKARRKAWELGSTKYNWDLEKGQFLQLVRQSLDR